MKQEIKKEEILVTKSMLGHLKDLKKTFINSIIFWILASIISYIYSNELYYILVRPLFIINQNVKIIYTNLIEPFSTYLKLSLYFGFIISMPWFAFQIYSFIKSGLYSREKPVLIIYFTMIPTLFYIGLLNCYFYIFPLAWKFFMSFTNSDLMKIGLEAKISEYFNLSLKMMVAFGLTFEVPVVMMILIHLKIVSIDFFRVNRRISIVIIFILAAIITPPDILSQILLAFEMIFLYEITLFIANKCNFATKSYKK